MGPRRPDKRNAAYESIFGRPSATHHQGQFVPSPLSYPQQPQQPQGQLYPYYPQYPSQQLDRRTSQSSFRTPSGQFPNQGPAFQQPYYPSNSSASQSPHPGPTPFQQQPYGYAHSLAPPSVVSRARSIGSSPGIIAPLPEEPPDPALEQFTQAGLTPAQAYQAQVNLSNGGLPTDQQQGWVQQEPQQRRRQQQQNQPVPSPSPSAPPPAPYRDSPRGPRPQSVHSVPPGADRVPEALLPQINMEFEPDDGRLGLDFSTNGRASGVSTEVTPPSDNGLEEDLSELPYSKPQRLSTPNSVRSRMSVSSARGGGSGDFTNSPLNFPSSSSRPYPLQLDTAVASAQAAGASVSPTSSTLVDEPQIHPTVAAPVSVAPYGRRSSESAKTMPGQFHRNRSLNDRSHSMSATMSPHVRAMIEAGRVGRPAVPSAPPAPTPRPRRTPIVYPALLSRVAEAFKARLQLGDRVKDGLTYKDSFDGREAVDTIAYIIKTTDRNLALLLGRALDAQKFFHAVTYDHRLRDSSHDLYQFRTKLPSPFVSGELAVGIPPEHEELLKALGAPQPLIGGADSDEGGTTSKESPSPSAEDDSDKGKSGRAGAGSREGSPAPASPVTRPRAGSVSSDDVPFPTGVFTLLTDCYSPTCTRDRLCYSIACPRRLEQQARLNMKPQRELKKQISKESLGELVVRCSLMSRVPAHPYLVPLCVWWDGFS